MKKTTLLKSMLLLFALIVGSGSVWAETVTFDATKDVVANESSYQDGPKVFTAKDGSSWTAAGYGTTKNTQLVIGKGGANYLLTPDVAGTISSVAVTWSGNTSHYLALQTKTGTELEAKSNPSTQTTQTFSVTGSYSQLKLVGRRASGTSNAAATITKVVVTYTPSGGPTTYSVFYDGNGATSGTAPTDETAYSSGASVTVKGNTGSLARTGFTFDGWNTKADGTGTDYSADDSFTITANTTLYAKWNFVVTDGFFDFVNAAKQEPLADYGSEMTLSSDYTTTEKTWTAGNVTMVTSRVSGSGYRWWEADGTLRFYNGSKATFSVPSGYVITKIVTTGANFDEANEGTLSDATWTGASNEVALSVTGTRSIKTITVTYTTENQTITPAKQYTTLTSAYNLDFTSVSSDLKAYIATEVSGGAVQMTQVNKVPAGTGLVLKATTPGAAVNVPVFDGTSPDDVSSNKMTGSATTTTAIVENGGYILKEGVFQPATDGTLAAGKAYLAIAVSGGAHPLEMNFEEGDVTGISGIEKMRDGENETFFNLAGQRVAQPTKGLYIVNGKKVVLK